MMSLYTLPEGHKPFQKEAHRMSLDDNHTIYWDGNKLKTETKLPFIAKVVGWVVSLSAIAAAGASVVQTYIAYNQWQNPKTVPAVAAIEESLQKKPEYK